MNTQELLQKRNKLKNSRFDFKLQNNNVLTTLSFFIMVLILIPANAQNLTDDSETSIFTNTNKTKIDKDYIQVKGVVNFEDEPLLGVTIVLKGTTIGTATDSKGEFTFPRELNTGDVLMFSYLGLKTQEITINDSTSFITLTMVEDDIDILEALPVEKPYKSKRSKASKRRRSN